MGRGESKAQRHERYLRKKAQDKVTGKAAGKVKLTDGTEARFNGVLTYGTKDSALSPGERKTVETWENRRRNNKVEYAIGTDADGVLVGLEVRGSKHAVYVPSNYDEQPGGTFTHIHPRGDGWLGGTFSDTDLYGFARAKSETVRAAAKEGTYSMSKTSNFDANGFVDFVKKTNKEFRDAESKRSQAISRDLWAGKIDRQQYLEKRAVIFNTELVRLHEKYLKGQNTYGYRYTLEQI